MNCQFHARCAVSGPHIGCAWYSSHLHSMIFAAGASCLNSPSYHVSSCVPCVGWIQTGPAHPKAPMAAAAPGTSQPSSRHHRSSSTRRTCRHCRSHHHHHQPRSSSSNSSSLLKSPPKTTTTSPNWLTVGKSNWPLLLQTCCSGCQWPMV